MLPLLVFRLVFGCCTAVQAYWTCAAIFFHFFITLDSTCFCRVVLLSEVQFTFPYLKFLDIQFAPQRMAPNFHICSVFRYSVLHHGVWGLNYNTILPTTIYMFEIYVMMLVNKTEDFSVYRFRVFWPGRFDWAVWTDGHAAGGKRKPTKNHGVLDNVNWRHHLIYCQEWWWCSSPYFYSVLLYYKAGHYKNMENLHSSCVQLELSSQTRVSCCIGSAVVLCTSRRRWKHMLQRHYHMKYCQSFW